MADPARARKIADRVKELAASVIEHRIKDPRMGFVTVTDARVTPDLEHATVYYTVMGSDEDKRSTAAALASARGMIRSEVGKGLGTRVTPTLEFTEDSVPETAAAIDQALRAAKARDEQLAELARTATPAGESDPYRKPRTHSAEA